MSFWTWEKERAFAELKVGDGGLSKKEAEQRLRKYGPNLIRAKKEVTTLSLLCAQFKSPLILLLLFAALLSLFLGDHTDALIIISILVVSGLLGFFQEKRATDAVEKLLSIVKVKSQVVREGKEQEISREKIVPGDILLLNAGDIIPADSLIFASKDLFVDESALTGESTPAEKREGVVPEQSPLAKRTNALFMGSHVVSGTAQALVITTGKETEFGKISEKLKNAPPATAFELGVKKFGYLLIRTTLVLVAANFAINVFLGRPLLISFLFALALAVGLTPQLLPAIISINLAHGARRMAQKKVIVKRLSSIENFGSMNVFCVDKTGTLTEGKVELKEAVDAQGKQSEKTLFLGYINASLQSGYTNPFDAALLKHPQSHTWEKLDELPYDFTRKRISILVKTEKGPLLVTKGAFAQVFPLCNKTAEIEKKYEEYSKQGIRTLALATRAIDKEKVTVADEKEMTFVGFLLFIDPIKHGIAETLSHLKERGISLKIITGDNRFVAAHVAQEIGLKTNKAVTGEEIQHLNNHALLQTTHETDLFVEVEPHHKEKIIVALRTGGYIVGFLGDGINDTTALHTADVGISVDSAADVVKEVADIVLLKKDLSVLLSGIEEGRRTFVNTMKYIFMATSANFGNMFSMAGASLFLPFLPLLPKQVLLTNLFTDCPEMTIATDNIDPLMLAKPLRWDHKFIRKFMITFGLISSLFDFLTFGVLLFIMRANVDQFRTGWYVESVVSACLIVLSIRTPRPFFRSRPSLPLLLSIGGVVLFTLILPVSPLAPLFNFYILPPYFLLILGGIVALYIASVEAAKRFFFIVPKPKLFR